MVKSSSGKMLFCQVNEKNVEFQSSVYKFVFYEKYFFFGLDNLFVSETALHSSIRKWSKFESVKILPFLERKRVLMILNY